MKNLLAFVYGAITVVGVVLIFFGAVMAVVVSCWLFVHVTHDAPQLRMAAAIGFGSAIVGFSLVSIQVGHARRKNLEADQVSERMAKEDGPLTKADQHYLRKLRPTPPPNRNWKESEEGPRRPAHR